MGYVGEGAVGYLIKYNSIQPGEGFAPFDLAKIQKTKKKKQENTIQTSKESVLHEVFWQAKHFLFAQDTVEQSRAC